MSTIVGNLEASLDVMQPVAEMGRAVYLDRLASQGMYGGLALSNMCRKYDKSVFVYNGQDSSQHVIWARGQLTGKKSIDPAEWREVAAKPEVIDATNVTLLGAFQSAQSFIGRKDVIRGITIDGSKGFGMEAGDWDFGIRVSYQNRVQTLMEILENGSPQELADYRTFLVSEFVHELTHRYYQEGLCFGVHVPMETQAHAIQLLYEPRNNVVFNSHLRSTLRSAALAGGAAELEGYDKAQYLAVALFAARISQKNAMAADALADGLTDHAFTRAQTLLTDNDVSYLQTDVRDEFLAITDDELTDEAIHLAQAA
jgi:hypothetical protein